MNARSDAVGASGEKARVRSSGPPSASRNATVCGSKIGRPLASAPQGWLPAFEIGVAAGGEGHAAAVDQPGDRGELVDEVAPRRLVEHRDDRCVVTRLDAELVAARDEAVGASVGEPPRQRLHAAHVAGGDLPDRRRKPLAQVAMPGVEVERREGHAIRALSPADGEIERRMESERGPPCPPARAARRNCSALPAGSAGPAGTEARAPRRSTPSGARSGGRAPACRGTTPARCGVCAARPAAPGARRTGAAPRRRRGACRRRSA